MSKLLTSYNTYYPKVQTLFCRNDNFKLIEEDWRSPTLSLMRHLPLWIEEKVDGTNIRVAWSPRYPDCIEIAGRTEKSKIPNSLYQKLSDELFTRKIFENAFPELDVDKMVVIYGEGYGHKIQKDGSKYIKDDVSFIGFDVKIDSFYPNVNRYWLEPSDKVQVMFNMGLQHVPVISTAATIDMAISYAKQGYPSYLTKEIPICEGIIIRTNPTIYNKFGDRIISKLKYSDFEHA